MKSAKLFSCIAVLSGVSVALMPATVSAADWFEPSVGDISYEDFQDRWTGFYVGAHAGYGWLDTTDDQVGTVENRESVLAGLLAGASYQLGHFVGGVEIDFSLSSFKGDPRPPVSSLSLKADYLGSVRGRVGAAFQSIHVYTTAGLFAGHQELVSSTTGRRSESIQPGVVYGLGAEYAVTDRLAFGAEVLRHQLFEDDYTVNTTFTADGLFDVIRARVTFMF